MIQPIELQATLSQIFLQKQIITVTCGEIEWCEKFNEDFNDTFFTIAINEDRLHEMGFLCLGHKRNWFDKTLSNGMEVSFSIEGTFAIYIKGKYKNIKKDIKSVHELQNLIYTISGEILKITE